MNGESFVDEPRLCVPPVWMKLPDPPMPISSPPKTLRTAVLVAVPLPRL